MVISSKTETDLYIPAVVGDAKQLILKSNMDNTEIVVSGSPQMVGDYYVFKVDFSNVQDGEYTYIAGSDKGIIRVGDYKEQHVSYTSDNKNIQYNAFD